MFNEKTGECEGTFDNAKLAGECLADWTEDEDLVPETADNYGMYILRVYDLRRVWFEKAEEATQKMRKAFCEVCEG